MALTWSNLPDDQKSFVQQLDKKLLQLAAIADVNTYYSETEPTSTNLVSAVYERTQWVQPSTNRLRNTYIRVEDGAAANTTTYKPYPMVPVPVDGSYLTPIATFSNGNSAGAAAFTFSAIPQTFKHLYLYVHYKDTSTAAQTVNAALRVNGSAAALYSLSSQNTNTNIAGGGEQASGTSWLIQVPTSISTNYPWGWMDGWFKFTNYAATARTAVMRGRASASWANPTDSFTVTTVQQGVNLFGIWNSTASITSLSFTGSVGSAAGTRLVLYGI